MAEMVVRFVKQGSMASSIMQQAFQVARESDGNCTWMSEEDCLQVAQRDRKSVFIFGDFSGEAFEHIEQTKNRIYGPMCIVTCMENGTQLPKADHPVANIAMKGFSVSCTSVEKDVRARIHQRIEWMAGEVHRDFSDQVTHLVAAEVGSKKYVVAAKLGKKVMSPLWVDKLWEASNSRVIKADNTDFLKFKCPVFCGLVMTVSGLESDERLAVREAIEKEGGRYSGEMKIKECTHLVINKPRGQKYEFAKKWKIHIVRSQWIFASIEAGYCLEEHKFRVTSSGDDLDQEDRTSTPTKTKMSMSALSDISAISVSHIDETAMNYTRLTNITSNRVSTDNMPPPDPLDELDVTMVKADMFLDGCKVFLSGFRGQKLEKLRRLINLGGGTRFNQINESVSHVIIGERLEDHIKQLKEFSQRPHIVNVNWLLECVKQGEQVSEEPYLSEELPPPDPPTPKAKPKSTVKRQSTAPRIPLTERNERKEQEPEQDEKDMQDLLSQYLPQNNTDMTDESALLRAVEAGEAELQKQKSPQLQQQHQSPRQQQEQQPEEDDDATQDPNSDTVTGADAEAEIQPFEGKSFVIFGFEPQDETQLAGFVTEAGGKVVQANSRSIPDYAVVPIFGCPVSMTVGDIVTNAWLQICLESETLHPVDENELFTPISLKPDQQPLEGCVLSVSGYTGTERDCLMLLAEEMGAVCQEFFLRKPQRGLEASTHLVVNAAEGSKYQACKKWNLPAVSKYWLFECAKMGQRKAEADYLVDNPNKGIPNKSPVIAKEDGKMNGSRASRARLSVARTEDDEPPDAPQDKLSEKQGANLTPMRESEMDTIPIDVPEGDPDITLVENNNNKEDSGNDDQAARTEVHDDNENEEKDIDSSLDRSDKENLVAEFVGAKNGRAEESLSLKSKNTPVQKQETALPYTGRSKNTPVQKTGPRAGESSGLRSRSSPIQKLDDVAGRSENTPVAARLPSRSEDVTPVLRNNRVKELIHQDPKITPRERDQRGIDTPGKFLNPDQQFLPKFDLGEAMESLQSPVCPGGNHNRRNSVPLDDAFGVQIAKAIENSMAKQPGTPAPNRLAEQRNARKQQQEASGPLKGVVIGVSKKLSSHQSEYNNIASKLGADYRWTYDPSCTHFIFQGRANDLAKEFRTARDQGKIIVCPHWLNVCQEQNARVDESLFPHTYNPNQVLSLSISKTPTTARRRPTRATRAKKDDVPPPSPEPVPQPKTRGRRKQSGSVQDVSDKGQSTSGEEEKEVDLDKTQSDEEMAKACADVENYQDQPPASMALVNDLKNLMAATSKTYSKGRRRSRRNDSMEQLKSEESLEAQRSRPSSRLSDKNSKLDDNEGRNSSGKDRSSRTSNRSRNSRKAPDSCAEPSQMVEVTWDDPGAREQQEILADELAKQSESFSPRGGHQFSSDDEHHPQLELRTSPVITTKKPEHVLLEEHRVPTPEPPSLAFPLPTSSSSKESPQPVELIEEEEEEESGGSVKEKSPPVFLLSGMAQQERDNYGALVEHLGGEVRDATFYDATCTHLVVGQPTRNEKYLACVAAGKWVLHKSYFEACREESCFVQEDGHEWGGEASSTLLASVPPQVAKLARAANSWRLKLCQMRKKNPNCIGAFDGWRVMIMSEKKREDGFRRLLIAGGADVLPSRPPFSNLDEVTHAFMDTSKVKLQLEFEAFVSAGVHCVKPEYIASYLMDNPVPDPQQFYIPEVQHLALPSTYVDPTKKRKSSQSAASRSKRTRHH